jgi:hypothetical protein
MPATPGSIGRRFLHALLGLPLFAAGAYLVWGFGLFLLAVGIGIVVAPWSAGWRAIILRTLAFGGVSMCGLVGAAWIGHRPLYALSLLAVAAAIGAGLFWRARQPCAVA